MKSIYLLLGVSLTAGLFSCQKDTLSDLQSESTGVNGRGGIGSGIVERCNSVQGNPFAETEGFNVFIENDVTVQGKENKTNMAIGRNFIMSESCDKYKFGYDNLGTYQVGGDSKPTAAYIGGTIIGNGHIKVNNHGYIKVGNTDGITCVPDNKLKLYRGTETLVESDANEVCEDVSRMGPLNFKVAFMKLRETNRCLASQIDNVTISPDGKIRAIHPVSFITLSPAQLAADREVEVVKSKFNNVLVINLVGTGSNCDLDFKLKIKADPEYTLINVTQMPSVHFFKAVDHIKAAILAPDTDAIVDDKELEGQMVFKNMTHTNKHDIKAKRFKGIIKL
jgi:choice-of-anchor A domain-containing protein